MTTTDQPEQLSWAPCAACGVRVEGPFAADALDVVTAYGTGRGDGFRDSADFAVTRCATCEQIRSAANDLLRAHRRFVPASAATTSRYTASKLPSMLSTRWASTTRA